MYFGVRVLGVGGPTQFEWLVNQMEKRLEDELYTGP